MYNTMTHPADYEAHYAIARIQEIESNKHMSAEEKMQALRHVLSRYEQRAGF